MAQFSLSQAPFKNGKAWVYSAEWQDLEKKTSFNDLIILKKRFGRANGMQKKIQWVTYPNLCVDTSITNAIYSLFEDSCITSMCEARPSNVAIHEGTTGMTISTSAVWLHPPRIKYYKILEFSPFPQLSFVNNSITDSIELSSGWGKFIGEVIKAEYSIAKKSENVYEVTAISSSSLGICKALFIYDRTIGFTRLEYTLFDKYSLTLELKS